MADSVPPPQLQTFQQPEMRCRSERHGDHFAMKALGLARLERDARVQHQAFALGRSEDHREDLEIQSADDSSRRNADADQPDVDTAGRQCDDERRVRIVWKPADRAPGCLVEAPIADLDSPRPHRMAYEPDIERSQRRAGGATLLSTWRLCPSRAACRRPREHGQQCRRHRIGHVAAASHADHRRPSATSRAAATGEPSACACSYHRTAWPRSADRSAMPRRWLSAGS